MNAAFRVLSFALGLVLAGAFVARAQESKPAVDATDVRVFREALSKAAGDLAAVFKEVNAEGASPMAKFVGRVWTATPRVTVRSRDLDLDLAVGVEYIARSGRSGEFEGDLYFAGYGVSEPERDDYKSFAAEGRVLLLLPGRPPEWSETSSRRLAEAASLEGKLRRAAQKGARGVLFAYGKMDGGIPTDDPAWAELARSWKSGDEAASERLTTRAMALEGWMPWDIARVLCSGARENLGNLAARARDLTFSPVPLEVVVQIQAEGAGTSERQEEAIVGRSRTRSPAEGRTIAILAETRTMLAERAGGGLGPAGEAGAAAVLSLGRDCSGLSWCFAPADALTAAGSALVRDAEAVVVLRSAYVETPLVVGHELSSLGAIEASARAATGFSAASVRDERAAGGDDRGAVGAPPSAVRPYLEIVLPIDADTETRTATARILVRFLELAVAAGEAPKWLDAAGAAESRPAETRPAK